MMRTAIAVVTAFFLFSSAFAEPVAATPSAKDVPPAKLALAGKMVEVLRLRQTIGKMLSDFEPVMLDQQSKLHPEMTPDQLATVKDVLDEVMTGYTDKFIQRYMPVYASTFSEEEMNSIIAFYSTPAGQALPQLSAASAQLTREMLPDLQKEAIVKLCSKVDCLGSAPPKSPKQQPS